MIVDVILVAIFVTIMAAVVWLVVHDGPTQDREPRGGIKKSTSAKDMLPTGSDESSRIKPI